MEDHVDLTESGLGRGPHPGMKEVLRVEQAGQIVEDELGFGFGQQTDDGEPGGLGLGADNREMGTGQPALRRQKVQSPKRCGSSRPTYQFCQSKKEFYAKIR